MDLDIGRIIEIVNSVPGGITFGAAMLWLLPRIIKKETLGKWSRSLVRKFLPMARLDGQGWRATVLYVASQAVDEADKVFEEMRG